MPPTKKPLDGAEFSTLTLVLTVGLLEGPHECVVYGGEPTQLAEFSLPLPRGCRRGDIRAIDLID